MNHTDTLTALVTGNAPKLRGALGELRSATAIERRAELIHDAIDAIGRPVPITAPARDAYRSRSRYDHEFDGDDDGEDARLMVRQYVDDAVGAASDYAASYRDHRREGWSALEAADFANDDSGLAADLSRAHDAILLLAAALGDG